MIGFVIALKSEAEYLLNRVEDKKQITLADKEAYLCKICKKDCVIAISGIGKVNAGLTTQILIDKFNVDCIFNFGSCGGTNNSVELLNYYAIDECCQYDFDLSELDPVPVGYIQDYNRVLFPTNSNIFDFLKSKKLASSDRFTNKLNDVNTVNSIGCSLCDMEGGAIAQVCLSNNVKLYIIKGITDIYGSQSSQEQFFSNLKAVCQGFPEVIFKAIDKISN